MLHCGRGTSKGSQKFSQPNKGRYQPKLAVQNLIGLARGESDSGRLGFLIPGLWEPMVMMQVEGQSLTFMWWILERTTLWLLTGQTATIVGAPGAEQPAHFAKLR